MVEGELRVEIDAEAAFGIQRAVLLAEVGVELGVNDLQSGTDAHGRAVGLHHLGVTGIHAHARPNGGLSHIYRGDVTGFELGECAAQFALQFGKEIAARDGRRIFLALAADQHDGGGECVGSNFNSSSWLFCVHWPSPCDTEARMNDT